MVKRPIVVLIQWLLFIHHLPIISSNTARYRPGYIELLNPKEQDTLIATRDHISVAQARQTCSRTPDCVAFGFESANTRFPSSCSRVFFYRHADWHTAYTQFIDDPSWHLWVNTTREIALIPIEIERILKQLDALICGGIGTEKVYASSLRSSLRSSAGKTTIPNNENVHTHNDPQLCLEEKARILDAIFHLVFPKEWKAVAAPLLIPKMVELSQAGANTYDAIRRAAVTNLIVLADSPKTAPLLVGAGVYEAMKTIVQNEAPRNSLDWTGMPILALDVISNIAMYRTANPLLQQKGAPALLTQIRNTTTGFPALQSTLALLHMESEREMIRLPNATLQELVQLLQTTLDGDVVYGILWDLIPGPLSALQLLVQQRIHHDATLETLLKVGLIEELVRVLEEPCRTAPEVEAALEILQGLALVSEPAREMIYLVADSIQQAQQRLAAYQEPAQLAQQLAQTIAKPNFVAWAEEL